MNYIGITIILAIILSLYGPMNLIEGEYISYILILVQISALTILFGFIIMLYPRQIIKKDKMNKFLILFSFIIISLFFNSFFSKFFFEDFSFPNHFLQGSLESHNFSYYDIKLLRNIGELLYTDNNTIVKFLVLTIILLLAIVGLFFII